MMLAPIWEAWNWGDGESQFFGALLLLYSAYAIGFAAGSRAFGVAGEPPRWVLLALFTLPAGMVLVLATLGSDPQPIY